MDRATTDTLAIPVDAGALVRPCVIATGTGWAIAWAYDGGRDKRATGLSYATARQALAVCRAIRGRIDAYERD